MTNDPPYAMTAAHTGGCFVLDAEGFELARNYMLRCGLTEAECDALYENLSHDYVLPLAA